MELDELTELPNTAKEKGISPLEEIDYKISQLRKARDFLEAFTGKDQPTCQDEPRGLTPPQTQENQHPLQVAETLYAPLNCQTPENPILQKQDTDRVIIAKEMLDKGTLKASDLKTLVGVRGCVINSYMKHYWFEKKGWGLYDLSPKGREEVTASPMWNVLEALAVCDPDHADKDSKNVLHDKVFQILKRLHTRHRQIIIQRFGLDGEEPKSLEEIAKINKITKERVRQLQNKSLARIMPELRALHDTMSDRPIQGESSES